MLSVLLALRELDSKEVSSWHISEQCDSKEGSQTRYFMTHDSTPGCLTLLDLLSRYSNSIQ